MSTFDDIAGIVADVLGLYANELEAVRPILVNRDLMGRVRLIVKDDLRGQEEAEAILSRVGAALSEGLGQHAYPKDRMVLFEPDMEGVIKEAPSFALEGVQDVFMADRLAMESTWSQVANTANGAPRIVFFSIKGGVGRSTSLAASAWALAESGKRVLVLDMDLESPGLSSSLLPEDRRPKFGITDWLVEDLVDNGEAVIGDMIATSELSHNGDIYVVPAHGADAGEYIPKLGRVWMPKSQDDGRREAWSARLVRLLNALEERIRPDVVLIDSRAGIDEVASACVTDLGASTVLLFSIDGEQTWAGYRILFQHWRKAGVVQDIRERLQVVGSMIPEVGGAEYARGLLESAWTAFSEELYDEVPAGEPTTGDRWSFDQHDEAAPHYPWHVRWHRNFAVMRSLHHGLSSIEPDRVAEVFGNLLTGLGDLAGGGGEEQA